MAPRHGWAPDPDPPITGLGKVQMAKYEKKSAPHDDPHPDILSPWRRLLSLPIPCHVHWPRSCCQSRARTAAICKKACFRGPTACMLGRVCSGRSCVRGALVRRGCAAGAWTTVWVRGGGSCLSGRTANVGRVPLATTQTRVVVVLASALGAGRHCVFVKCGVGHAWVLGLVRRQVALSGLLRRSPSGP